jgi:hypothetical protein
MGIPAGAPQGPYLDAQRCIVVSSYAEDGNDLNHLVV